jgi:hypothetical protein
MRKAPTKMRVMTNKEKRRKEKVKVKRKRRLKKNRMKMMQMRKILSKRQRRSSQLQLFCSKVVCV